MARTKAVPLRREASDLDQGLPEVSIDSWKHTNTKANGNASPVTLSNGKSEEPSQEQAGLTQLIICVAGIYASL